MNDTAGDLTEARILPTEDETNTSTPSQQPTPAQPTPVQQPTPSQQPASSQQPTPATSQAESVMQSIQQNTTDLLLQNNHDVGTHSLTSLTPTFHF